MRIKVLVDDMAPEGRLSAHGLSVLVTTPDITLLFDTGPEGDILMEALDIESVSVADLDLVVISHDHTDHTGGLSRLLYERPRLPVSAPLASAPTIAKMLPREAVVLGERGTRGLAPHIRTTGMLPGDIPEQALVLSTNQGVVVLTGCGHAGLGMILAAVGTNVSMIIGGLHDLSDDDVGLTSLDSLVVCHCTPRKRILAHSHDWVEMGMVGTVLELEPPSDLSSRA